MFSRRYKTLVKPHPTSRCLKRWDGLWVFESPEGEEDRRSTVTARVVGIPSTLSRDEILSNLEVMAGDTGLIQAIYLKVVVEDGVTRFSGEGFVHCLNPRGPGEHDCLRGVSGWGSRDALRTFLEGVRHALSR